MPPSLARSAALTRARFDRMHCSCTRTGCTHIKLNNCSAVLCNSCFPLKQPLDAVRSVGPAVKSIVVHTGRLFGASGGEEPVPFLTGPKAEPVLDESVTRQAVLVGPGTVLSSVSQYLCTDKLGESRAASCNGTTASFHSSR